MENPTKLYSILKRLTKQEILKYSKKMCEHGHPLISHPACLAKAVHFEERIGYLDIETSNFDANYGIVISYAIKEEDGKVLSGVLRDADFNDKDGNYDRRILQYCIEDMAKFDRLVVYWGKDRRHDIPYTRTRALMMGLQFPMYQEQIVNDLYDVVKNKLKLGRNSLQSACTAFGIESKEHPITPDIWKKAIIGRDKKALSYILQHNVEDVIATELLHKKLRWFSSEPKTSI